MQTNTFSQSECGASGAEPNATNSQAHRLPEPLSPPQCDLRDLRSMPLFGHELFTGPLYLQTTAEEFRAVIRLRWAAWNQVRAGSLPADDEALALLADYGRDLSAWAQVRDKALHGFVRCSDDRLYHPSLSEAATEAFDQRRTTAEKRKRDAARLKAWRASQRGTEPGATRKQTCRRTQDETRFVTGSDRDRAPIDRQTNPISESTTATDGSANPSHSGTSAVARKGLQKPTSVILPDWLPIESWNAWLEMRRRKREAPSERAIMLAITKLEQFWEDGHDPAEVLDQSVLNGWKGLFAPKPSSSAKRQSLKAKPDGFWDRVPDAEERA